MQITKFFNQRWQWMTMLAVILMASVFYVSESAEASNAIREARGQDTFTVTVNGEPTASYEINTKDREAAASFAQLVKTIGEETLFTKEIISVTDDQRPVLKGAKAELSATSLQVEGIRGDLCQSPSSRPAARQSAPQLQKCVYPIEITFTTSDGNLITIVLWGNGKITITITIFVGGCTSGQTGCETTEITITIGKITIIIIVISPCDGGCSEEPIEQCDEVVAANDQLIGEQCLRFIPNQSGGYDVEHEASTDDNGNSHQSLLVKCETSKNGSRIEYRDVEHINGSQQGHFVEYGFVDGKSYQIGTTTITGLDLPLPTSVPSDGATYERECWHWASFTLETTTVTVTLP